MYKLLDFQSFVNEANNKKLPIQILMRGTIGLTSKTEDFTKKLMKTLYEKYIHLVLIKGTSEYNKNKKIPDNRKNNKINFSLPILNFTSHEHDFLKHKDAKILNKIADIKISANKIKFNKTFADADFIPTTVYNIKDIKKLTLPIIAKPKDGFSAQGIKVFDSYEDAQKSKLKFDMWSDKKDIETEFRAFIMNNKIIHIAERITNTSNDKSVDKKDPDEKIDLIYIDQDLNSFPYLEKIQKIKDVLSKKLNIDFYNIDLMLDKDSKIWVPEINSAPGIGPSMFYSIYKNYLQFAYNTKIDNTAEKELKDIRDEHRSMMKSTYPKEYKNSVNPV